MEHSSAQIRLRFYDVIIITTNNKTQERYYLPIICKNVLIFGGTVYLMELNNVESYLTVFRHTFGGR